MLKKIKMEVVKGRLLTYINEILISIEELEMLEKGYYCNKENAETIEKIIKKHQELKK